MKHTEYFQIEESGLSLHAFDDFDEAAEKVIELARQGD